MAKASVPPNRGTDQIRRLLAMPEVANLIADLEATRWTGRPGYPIRAMVGMALVKSLYVLPTWTRTVRLVAEHAALRKAIGGAPSVDACYRFTAKLRQHKGALDACIASVLASLHNELPEFGEHVAIDGSDLPAYANGQRFVYNHGPERKRFSDPDASWGHRSAISTRKGGGFYGYKLHAAVCTTTGLPVAWETHTARDAEVPVVPALLDKLAGYGIDPTVAIADRGYDVASFYEACESRDIRPVVPLRETPFVKAGKAAPPNCEHGVWTFAGSDAKAWCGEVPLPLGRVLPGKRVDQGGQAPHADPSRDAALEGPVPEPWRRRAGVRPVEARMGLAAPAGASDRAGCAAR